MALVLEELWLQLFHFLRRPHVGFEQHPEHAGSGKPGISLQDTRDRRIFIDYFFISGWAGGWSGLGRLGHVHTGDTRG